ncbi:ABC transporter substrate-binding protein [Flavobacterium sp. HSC-61S13]|uniref:ABC transporter substrate-binding protein n=1 Tax=Flavobacterium sp. HSC-61S13 TaxID=2910963 RepID=UPI0020A18F30|nr:helical backbone metal receptor [Flavobacterium sp. HSC-61S13]MCP1994737.1 ABC-type Fe3+-hydroxamate transport system substrate-binding protein [Flavobacterium sp. HSC-61S13]
MATFYDQLGQQHHFDKTPQRIVSLVPSQTELLFDLGLEDSIVGITKFCVHPYHFKSTKKSVGGTKKVHFEKIKLLQPDIIIANKEENTLEIVEQLRAICPVWVTDVITIEDNEKMISDFGVLFNKRTDAQKWNDKIRFAQKDFMKFVSDKPIQKAAYFIWRDPYMAAGDDTFINELLKINRFENIYANKAGRYPEIELKKIRLEGDPDLVFLSSEPYPFKEEHAFEIGRCTHHAKTVFVDGEMFSWYGTRLLRAFEYFKILHQRIN